MASIKVSTRGIKEFDQYLADFPERTVEAARLAINDTVKWTRTRASREMRKQVNFPANYLDNQADGRLYVSRFATGNNLEAVITGRRRATSLARFTSNAPQVMSAMNRKGGRATRPGLKVQVTPGRTRIMRKAFPIKLRAGNKDLDTAFNMGIALRLPKGTAMTNKRAAKAIPGKKSDLYLLYAPSVDQVFRDVAQQLQEPAARKLEDEFLRQFNRLTGG